MATNPTPESRSLVFWQGLVIGALAVQYQEVYGAAQRFLESSVGDMASVVLAGVTWLGLMGVVGLAVWWVARLGWVRAGFAAIDRRADRPCDPLATAAGGVR